MEDDRPDPRDGGEEAREPWLEGPDDEAPEESWLALDDDALLHRIQTLAAGEDHDQQLLDVVASHRHFFIRQEAAKRVVDRKRLFAFEDDRHVGQILVRHLNRREDLTYLERLSLRSRHVEVRSAAQVQLARVWKKLEAPVTQVTRRPIEVEVPIELEELPPEPAALAELPVPVPPLSAGEGPVDASLLCWAAHFLVESAWHHLGTTATCELLRRTRAELVNGRPVLASFEVTPEAHVTGRIGAGVRVPREAVRHLAEWMIAFRAAAAQVAPEVVSTSVRACTSLMADALRNAGFYEACDLAESAAARPAGS